MTTDFTDFISRDALTDEWIGFCNSSYLPQMSADDLLFIGAPLGAWERAFIYDFIERWEAFDAVEGAFWTGAAKRDAYDDYTELQEAAHALGVWLKDNRIDLRCSLAAFEDDGDGYTFVVRNWAGGAPAVYLIDKIADPTTYIIDAPYELH